MAGDRDFAQSYLEALASRGASDVAVAVEDRDRVSVQSQAGGGFWYSLRMDSADDR